MSLTTLDERGRITLPSDIRVKLGAKRFLVILEGHSVKLVPLQEPDKVKGSVKIPWSIEELEEAGEEFVPKRAKG